MSKVVRFPWRLFVSCFLLLFLVSPTITRAVGEIWVVAGNFQDDVPGVSCGEWDNACADTTMADDDGDGVHRFVADGLPAGSYEYKIVESGNWDNAHPANNVVLPVDGNQVRWYFLPGPNNVADNMNQCIATVAGSFQDELGGAEWAPDNLRTMMWPESAGSDWYAVTVTIPAGSWEYKVARDEAWDVSYPASNVAFTLDAETAVTFRYNCATNDVEHVIDAPAPDPAWVVAGNFQDDVPGVPCGEWDNVCAETGMEDDNGDGVYRFVADSLPAGSYEYKVVEFNNWDNAHPANNVALPADGEQVRWYFQPGPNNVADNMNQCIATVAGNFQDELGGPEWAPDNLRSMMWPEAPGSDWYAFTATLPAGEWEYKVARNEAWDESYPANNVPLSLAAESNVTVRYNCATNEVEHTISGTGASHDNDIWWDDLGHDSRDSLYRTPGGAVPAGAEVTLRLRAASGDLTAAQLRLWDDRQNTQILLDMDLVADDGTYEWWQAAVPVSADATIYWYRFIAIDGSATAYYEDDAARDGGWGQTFGDSPDNSWQLTMYDPAFQTPDWVKNGIMYQIFPDRFRDGDPANNTPAGSFFYDMPGGSIVRSGGTDWHTPICDPRDPNACFQSYSQNFYGGDLQGIIDQLDYLQGLGVTVIYLNPIFESPSNHKYDTTDYSLIDDNFGDLALFQTLAAEAHNRGMHIVLDGVFNHTSSDSLYFDRYGRYPAPDSACESESSDFRDWYFFDPAPTPGTGVCAGDTNYTSWFGFDSLPKLDSGNQEVRDLIWSGGPDAVGRYWLQWADGWRLDVAGDVDPGVTNDANNEYWEGFRAAVHSAHPEAYIVGEEWNVATAWTLGNEWDATMNYQFGSAIMSFWRDTPFNDNDHNPGSSAGELAPLTPSQLDARLHNLEERYPPESFQAMMNLLGSHDTNRALFMLDENTGLQDDTLYDDPNYDWSDAMTRLKGVVLLQMTLPGAPTIYYGDEVGLVGPVTWDGSTWQDDPYNRLPYPWLDESGTPYYTHLQTQTSQDDLLNYYQTLTAVRNTHPALRTGSFDTLLVDDGSNVYAYGRLSADYADAAVVIANRATAAQDVTVNVGGYLPVGASFVDALNGGSYSVDAGGDITVPGVPGMSGAVLVLDGVMAAPPEAVNDLAVTGVRSGEIDLAWSAAAGADSYDIYRSLVSGGGYALVTNTTGTSFTDTGLANATTYHYIVVSRHDTNFLSGDPSNEVSGIPGYDLSTAWFNLQWPPSIVHTISTENPTENIYGQLWISGVTLTPGATEGILAQVGFGPNGSPPDDTWTWTAMNFNVDVGENDEYVGNLLPDTLGTFDYVTRYSADGGATWFYADLNGPGINGNPGDLQVVASGDTTAPAAPTNLAITGTSNGHIAFSWDANGEADLAGYEIFRQESTGPGFAKIAVVDAAVTSYSDTGVSTGGVYDYYVVAFDTSFNRSAPSDTVTATAEARLVSVTFRIGVPDYTPGTVYLVGSIDALGPWDPGLVPMAQVDATTWTHTMDILDGTQLEFKFTRGNWETVEAWGSIVGLTNRAVAINFGADGTQLVDLTATDWGNGPDDEKAVQLWRDPIVTGHSPADGAIEVAFDTAVTVNWSLPMAADTSFDVTGPAGTVAGSFSTAGDATTYTPDAPLAPNTTYSVLVSGQESNGNFQQVPATFSFTTRALTLDEQFDLLAASIEALVADGALSARHGRALTIQLKVARLFEHVGFDRLAMATLNFFIHRVEVLITSGQLSAANGNSLIEQAEAIIEAIQLK